MEMKYEVIEEGSKITLKLSGTITLKVAEKFKEILDSVVDKNPQTVELDFEDMEKFDSDAAGKLIYFYKRIRKQTKDIKIIKVSTDIDILFKRMGLYTIFSIEKSESELEN